jgi:uncharacterized protein (TIGR02246 family)
MTYALQGKTQQRSLSGRREFPYPLRNQHLTWGAAMQRFLRSFLRGGSLFCVFFFAAQEPAPTQPSGEHAADREAISTVLRAQQSAWNRADVDAFLEGYWHSPKLTFSGSNGVARGWDAVRARYKKNYPDRAAMGQLNFSDLEFRFLGPDAALVLGKWRLQREKDELGGVFTLVWQRFPDGWKIIHDHTSVVAAPKINP